MFAAINVTRVWYRGHELDSAKGVWRATELNGGGLASNVSVYQLHGPWPPHLVALGRAIIVNIHAERPGFSKGRRWRTLVGRIVPLRVTFDEDGRRLTRTKRRRKRRQRWMSGLFDNVWTVREAFLR